MATTMFFEEILRDKGGAGEPIHVEFGRSSYYDGESLVYLTVDDQTVILDEATGRRLIDAMASLGGYLGYNN